MTRAFISIDIPVDIKEEIKQIQERLPEFYGKKAESENLHLTLKFLGDTSEEKIRLIKEKLKEIKFEKFETKIDSIGVFNENFVRIIWLHLSNCGDLQKIIDENLKNLFEPEKRFMSHLTIARVKSLDDKKCFLEGLNKIKISQIKFVVDNFRLKESVLGSEGPSYKTIEEYALK